MVGGCVRDAVLGLDPKDLDVEMYGVPEGSVATMLKESAENVIRVGREFPVWKAWTRGMSAADAIDVALPRREVKTGPKHTDFLAIYDPGMSYHEAALRRDYTMNALALDPLTGEKLDPHGGERDLQARVLRHTSPQFAEDPLRVLRGMQFCGRFVLDPDPETVRFCAGLTLEGLSSERIFGEWEKFILKSKQPSKGLEFLRQTGWLKHFPELSALRGVNQHPIWHPEGDVFEHTKHCLDAFATRVPKLGDPADDLRIGLAVLCHDFGKVTHTALNEDGKWTSSGHEAAGEAPTRAFLGRMTDQSELINAVAGLVKRHMLPRDLWAHTQREGSPDCVDKSLRRLAREVRLDQLAQVCRCDKAGRPPLSPVDVASDWLWDKACNLKVLSAPPKPLLLGRDLIALGYTPSPAFKNLLNVAFERQLDGEVKTHEEALALATCILAGRPVGGTPLETVTLYRAQPLPSTPAAAPSWSDTHPQVAHMKTAAGRWFTDDRAEAEWYIRNEYFDNGLLVTVTLPKAQAEFYRVSNLPVKAGGKDAPDNPRAYSRRPEKEFFLPTEVALRAEPLLHEELSPLSAKVQLRPPQIDAEPVSPGALRSSAAPDLP